MTENDSWLGATKKDVAMATIVLTLVLVGGLVAVTYVIADKTELKITGTIDIGEYSTVILLAAGGGLVYLGISAANKIHQDNINNQEE